MHSSGTHVLRVPSFEDDPPWGTHIWQEECGAAGSAQSDVSLTLRPGYTDHDCSEALALLASDLTNFCFGDGTSFETALTQAEPPPSCPVDCAHTWYRFAEGCAVFLARVHPGFVPFSEMCNTTISQMSVLEVDGTLDASRHSHEDHLFTAREDFVYEIDEIPEATLQRTGLALEVGHSRTVLANRLDISRHGAGAHHIEFEAPQTEDEADLAVDALEGAGAYHLSANVIGTVENLAVDAVLDREVLLAQRCEWFDDCSYDYDGLRMRGDGSAFVTRFHATAGLTYKFNATLQQGSATFLRLAIYQPDSMGTAKTGMSDASAQMQEMFGVNAQQCADNKPSSSTTDDVTEFRLGRWIAADVGRPSWEEIHNCQPTSDRIGPPDQPCSGSYRHFPGHSYNDSASWEWTCPFSATYLLQFMSNCDVPFYADPERPDCIVTEDGTNCFEEDTYTCESQILISIQTVDRSVRVVRHIDLLVQPSFADSREAQAQMADMFALDQQPAVVFTNKITVASCRDDTNMAKPICATQLGRRQLQGRSCPHGDFLRRDMEMRATCGLEAFGTMQLDTECPSLECSDQLLAVLADCSESVRHIDNDQQAAFYTQLEDSILRSSCVDLAADSAAMFATVQVEYRAPSKVVAERLATHHQTLLDGGLEQVACGRRSLHEGHIWPSKAEYETMQAERDDLREKVASLSAIVAEQRRLLGEQAAVITEQTKIIDRQEKTMTNCKELCSSEDGRSTIDILYIEKMGQWHRRAQMGQSAASPDFSRTVLSTGAVRACATAPCDLAGTCSNGGQCIRGSAQSGAHDFTCRCLQGYTGPQCTDEDDSQDPCASGATLQGGVAPTVGTIRFRPAGGYPNDADCTWHIECRQGTTTHLSFEMFQIESTFDFINIYAGSNKHSTEIGSQLSGELVDLDQLGYISPGTEMTLQFRSDGSTSNAGFAARYSCVETQSCSDADAASSGAVDISDLLTLLGSYGQSGPNTPADVNHDGEVDVRDLLLLDRCYGRDVSANANAISDSVVTPYVTVVSTSDAGTTYQLGLTLSHAAANVYIIYGSVDSPLELPPAFQVDAPFGSNFGGVDPAMVAAQPMAEWDSWLTIGITHGEPGLGSVGLDWSAWTESAGISSDNGAVFWMNPDDGPANEAVVAQLTTSSGWTASFGAQGRASDGGDWQADRLEFSGSGGGANANAISDSIVTPYVTVVSTSDAGTTYQLGLTLSHAAANVYSIYGSVDFPLELPPAFQVAPPFGSNIGGVDPAMVAITPMAEWDSWLTIGITDGDDSGALTSVGLDWSAWTESAGISSDNGAVFWMNPDAGPANEAVVAQLTTSSGWTASFGAQGRASDGGDWQADRLEFSGSGGGGGGDSHGSGH